MSYKWPSKDKDETLDFSVDWSRYLDGATISSIRWYFEDADGVKTLVADGETVDGLTRDTTSSTTTVATIVLSDGDNNKEYKVYCSITDSNNNIAERSVKLRIKEQ